MAGYLKCDADGCDHVESCPPLTQDMVGKPCPKCGASLLTQRDFDDWQESVAPTISLLRDLGLLREPTADELSDADCMRFHLQEGKLTTEFPASPRNGEPHA